MAIVPTSLASRLNSGRLGLTAWSYGMKPRVVRESQCAVSYAMLTRACSETRVCGLSGDRADAAHLVFLVAVLDRHVQILVQDEWKQDRVGQLGRRAEIVAGAAKSDR